MTSNTAKRKGVRAFIDESGVIEVILLAITIGLFYYGYYLLAVFFAFALGVSATYVVDVVRERLGVAHSPYAKSKGIKRVLEIFGIVEIILIVATIWFYVDTLYILSVVGAFAFGIALVYALDRTFPRKYY